MECVAEIPLDHIDRRPRKRARLGWDVPMVQTVNSCGLEVNLSIPNPLNLDLDQKALSEKKEISSSCFQEDDKDEHHVFAVGEYLTPRYRIHNKMGEGTFGQVLECWDDECHEMVAVKVIKSLKKYREDAMIEIYVLEQLAKYDKNGSCFVQIRNWFDYRNHVCIVFEKLGPSLYDFLQKNGYRPFPVELVRDIGRQLLESIAFMHELHLIHTDLKPENVLLVSSECIRVPDCKVHIDTSAEGSYMKRLPKSSAIKVIDFGGATYHNENRCGVVSTRHYRAPEVILGLGWSYSCDIWSIGCILAELCSGEALFQTHEDLEHLAMMERVLGPLPPHMLRTSDRHIQKYVRRGRLDWPEAARSSRSVRVVCKLNQLENLVMDNAGNKGDFLHLLRGLLKYDPEERLTASQALRHPFFTQEKHVH